MREGVDIDGSRGEGGGQILRTSLALSVITGRPLRMTRIRAGRPKPGLQRQHLACVEAAARLCRAELTGGVIGSQAIDFVPGPVSLEDLAIDIGTAGSTTLVVQTILMPVLAAGHTLRATITGGTHNPLAPSFEFLDRVFLPHLHAMGAKVTLKLAKYGFAPAGGGRLNLEVTPSTLGRLDLVECGAITERKATAIVSRLPTHVADRELKIVREQLGFSEAECEVREVSSAGPGNALTIEIDRPGGRELVIGFGERETRAELVARRACDELEAYLAADVPVGEHLADQLLLPLAVVGAGSFRTFVLSQHATTNIETIAAFLDVPIRAERGPTGTLVTVG